MGRIGEVIRTIEVPVPDRAPDAPPLPQDPGPEREPVPAVPERSAP